MQIELKNLVKSYQDRLIFSIKELNVYENDRIGIVGLNGSGKTTLLNVISGHCKADEGTVLIKGPVSYIRQLEDNGSKILLNMELDTMLAGKLNVSLDGIDASDLENLSGGEKTRLKIAAALNAGKRILLADEPTSNLDIKGIEILEQLLEGYRGALLLVSHDRGLLDKICNKILEIEQGQVTIYPGNYSSYLEQKEQLRKRQTFEYQQFIKTKKKLTQALVQKKEQSKGVRKTPRRMGNSEARLHKMGNQKAKANLDKAAKALETRIDKLEVKNKPTEIERIKLSIQPSAKMNSNVLISGDKLNKAFDHKIIFSDASFKLFKGEKIALIGDNGCGKSTLIKMIVNGENGIRTCSNLKLGYFSQDLNILNESKSIIENVLATSVYDEAMVRTTLARLLFKRDEIYKPVSLLSGGEKVRVSFGKIIMSDINMLILDEPTNYLDIYAMEAVEAVLGEYTGSMLFVSHDRRFVNKLATGVLIIENQKIISFQGNYEQYCNKREEETIQYSKEQKMLLENRLSEVIGRITSPSEKDNVEDLDKMYKEIAQQLKEIGTRKN